MHRCIRNKTHKKIIITFFQSIASYDTFIALERLNVTIHFRQKIMFILGELLSLFQHQKLSVAKTIKFRRLMVREKKYSSFENNNFLKVSFCQQDIDLLYDTLLSIYQVLSFLMCNIIHLRLYIISSRFSAFYDNAFLYFCPIKQHQKNIKHLKIQRFAQKCVNSIFKLSKFCSKDLAPFLKWPLFC